MKSVIYLFLLFLLNSCIGGIKPEYYIKAKFDGKDITFKYLISGQKGLDNGKIVHLVWGASLNSGNSFPSYDLEIWNSNGEIKEGNIFSENDTNIISRYATDGFSRHNSVGNSVKDFQIKILEINSSDFKGTFSGTLTNAQGQNIIISDGEFYCPLKD